MIAEGGAFAATLDADSEGREGAYYVWDYGEIFRLMPNEDYARAFKDAYDIRPEGNFEGRIVLDRNKPQPPAAPNSRRSSPSAATSCCASATGGRAPAATTRSSPTGTA